MDQGEYEIWNLVPENLKELKSVSAFFVINENVTA